MKRIIILTLMALVMLVFALILSNVPSSQPTVNSESEPISLQVLPPYVAPNLSTLELTRFTNRNLSTEERFSNEVLSSIPRVSNANDIAAIVAVLADVQDDDSVRNEAANILARSHAHELLPTLIKVLNNPQERPRFRSFATQHLGSFLTSPNLDAQNRAALQLRQSLTDKDIEVRREAVWALVQIQEPSADALAAKWLTSAEPGIEQVRDLAVRCTVQMNRREFIPRLRELAVSPHENTRVASLDALSTWNDIESRSLFENAVKDQSERVRRVGAAALRRMDSLDRSLPREKQTVENLASMLRHERSQIRHEAAIALLRFKQEAWPALPAVIDALGKLPSDSKTSHIVAYLDVLRNIGAGAKCAAPVLSEMMAERASIFKDRNRTEVHRLRSYILLTMSDIDAVDTAVPFIVEALATSDDEMVFNFAAAARVAGRLGTQAAPLVPLLVRPLINGFEDSAVTLDSYHSPITPSNKTSASLEAIRALAQIGPGAAEARPALEKVANAEISLRSELPDCRSEARRALTAIQGTAGF